MGLNHLIKFCVTKDDLDMIKDKIKEKGYPTMSAYLREILFKSFHDDKISEIYGLLKEIKDGQTKQNKKSH